MSKGVHRFALLVAVATFLLIIAGANVTSHDAGLAVPDWPLSFGKFFPKMVGNVFWEHGHRLVAPECRLSCVARVRCVRGPEHRYTDEQLAFHMAASMPTRRPA